jgi:hypothetical protein
MFYGARHIFYTLTLYESGISAYMNFGPFPD